MLSDNSLHSSLHGVCLLFLAFSSNFLPLHDPCFDYEEHSHNVHEDHPHKCQSERPGEIVLLPVRHEISSITLSPKNDESNCSTGSWKEEKSIKSIQVMVVESSAKLQIWYELLFVILQMKRSVSFLPLSMKTSPATMRSKPIHLRTLTL